MTRANSANRNINRQQRDAIEATPGYAGSGTSQWERQAAHGGKVANASLADFNAMSRLDQIIHRNVKEAINLSERLSLETDPAEIVRLNKNLGIKQRFIDKLRSQK